VAQQLFDLISVAQTCLKHYLLVTTNLNRKATATQQHFQQHEFVSQNRVAIHDSKLQEQISFTSS